MRVQVCRVCFQTLKHQMATSPKLALAVIIKNTQIHFQTWQSSPSASVRKHSGDFSVAPRPRETKICNIILIGEEKTFIDLVSSVTDEGCWFTVSTIRASLALPPTVLTLFVHLYRNSRSQHRSQWGRPHTPFTHIYHQSNLTIKNRLLRQVYAFSQAWIGVLQNQTN